MSIFEWVLTGYAVVAVIFMWRAHAEITADGHRLAGKEIVTRVLLGLTWPGVLIFREAWLRFLLGIVVKGLTYT